ncbi:MAG: PDZ domain-containing protein [Gammaproteobacteria bacterium]|nr:PDZ domain-containing protein [Gammaproteobacteria bacterium]
MKQKVLASLIIAMSVSVIQFAQADIKAPQIEPLNSANSTKNQTDSWLGVWIENIPVSLGHHLLPLLKKDQGIIIKKISPNSPAAKAGLQPYDIIANFNDQAIFSRDQLIQLIKTTQPGNRVKLSLIRQGKLMTQDVMLEALPRKNQQSLNTHSHQNLPQTPFPGRFNHNFMNDPFFNSNFGRDFNQRFNQEMSQLRQQMEHLQQQMNQHNSQSNWSQFESVQIESLGNNKHRAEVKYKDSEGNEKNFKFEGNLDEMQQQIMNQTDMNDEKKRSLLNALDMNTRYSQPFNPNNPGWYNQPFPRPNWFQSHP